MPQPDCAARIRVAAGQVVDVTQLAERSSYPAVSAKTVPELFDDIRGILEGRPDWFQASYDVELGYPISVGVDGNLHALDDEWGFGIDDFQQLPH